jgi:hypothetical protein
MMAANKKGVFFTVMTMLLVTAIIASSDMLMQQREDSEKGAAELAALKASSAMLMSTESVLVNYTENQQINGRAIPLRYTIDGNRISLSHELPFSSAEISSFFDLLNGYRVFVSDTNYSNAYRGFTTDLNVPRNSNWGGSEESLFFGLQPLNLKYAAADTNASFMPLGADFNEATISAIDINIAVPAGMGHDFNRLSCSLEGYTGCPYNSMGSDDSRPYIRLSVNDNNCSGCALLESSKRAAFHINSSSENMIVLSCQGTGCSSAPVTVTLRPLPEISNSGNYIEVGFSVEGREEIESFFYIDFNASVRVPAFGAASVSERS